MSDLDKPISGLGSRRDVASTSRSERPSRIPEDKDDFKKLVDRRRDRSTKRDDDDDDSNVAEGPKSIFDMASKKSVQEQAGQGGHDSPFDLARQSKGKQEQESGMDAEASTDLSGLPVAKEKNASDEPVVKGRSFQQVHEDLTSVHPQHLSVSDVRVPVTDAKPTAMQASLQTLVDQIVDKLYTVRMGDITDTVMTIKNPPVFAGSELVVTSYNTARGEFNIAFANLSQEAKTLLDSQRANLMAALETQGYTAHIVVTTTEAYTRPLPEAPAPQPGQQQQKREEQTQDERQQQRRQQQQQE
ncbi:MAG: hypothetical protein Q8K75_04725 [Chlamydiales bacterium]|nr:hypothetical protein [Chlamydiales bacterium]